MSSAVLEAVAPPTAAPVPSPAARPAAARSRVDSIDVLRGLDVCLMLFVNQMVSVAGAPAFTLHYPAGADGMSLADLVFPAFLFIVGISVPFAVLSRRRRGD